MDGHEEGRGESSEPSTVSFLQQVEDFLPDASDRLLHDKQVLDLTKTIAAAVGGDIWTWIQASCSTQN